MTRIVGERVTLRAFREDELDRLVQIAKAAPTDDGIHWGPTEPGQIRSRIAASGSWSHGHLTFAVEAAGRLVGEIQARNTPAGMPPGVFELGVEVYDPADRGKGLGAAAVTEITRHLFRDEDAHRVQMTTDVANGGMRRVAERLGFGLEGVLRGYMPTGEGPRDYAMYAITRDDYAEVAARWT